MYNVIIEWDLKDLIMELKTVEIVQSFTNSAFCKYKTDAYVAGYFRSLVVRLIDELPKEKRDSVCKELIEGTVRLNIA